MTMQGLEALRQVLFAKEATKGTAITSASDFTRFLGTLSMSPERTFHTPVDERRSLAEYRRQRTIATRAALSIRGDSTYDNLIPFLGMSLKGGVSSVAAITGATTAKKHTFEPDLGAANDQDSYTWVYGDNARLFRAAYCQAQSIDLSSEMDGVLGLNASLFSHYPVEFAPASGYTDLTDPDDEPEINTNHAKIYIADVATNIWDPANLAVSGNLKEGLISSMSFRFPSGLAPLKTVSDGGLNFSTTVERRRHYEMDIEVLFDNSDALTEYNAWEDSTTRVMRVEYTGAEIEDVSGTPVPYSLAIQMAGKYGSAPQLFESREGRNSIRLSLMSMDTTIGTDRQEALVELVNTTA